MAADIFAPDERDRLNQKHAAKPEPGDYWHEMFCPLLVVIAVSHGLVIYHRAQKDVENNKWTWDLSKPHESKRLDEFYKWLEYDTIPGRFWVRCEPGAHKWVLDHTESEAP